MKSLPLLAFAAATLLSGAALADTPSSTATASAVKPAKTIKPSADDKVVCKTVTYTGSRLGGVRTCQTVAQWRDNEAESQKQTIDSQMRADTQNPNGR